MDSAPPSDRSADALEWSPRFSVGVAAIDDQHKRIVDMINAVIIRSASTTTREVISEALVDMIEYVDVHFRDEEALLKKHGYPGCKEQEDLHLEFTKRVVELCSTYRDDHETTRVDLLSSLKQWFLDHIRIEDMKFKEFLHDKGVS